MIMTQSLQQCKKLMGTLSLKLLFLILHALSHLPACIFDSMAKKSASLILMLLSKKRKTILQRNIKLVFPEWDEQTVQHFIHKNMISLATSMLQLSTIWRSPSTKWKNPIQLQGINHLTQAENEPNGLIILTPHFQNTEILGQILKEKSSKTTYYVYKQIQQQTLEQFTLNARGAQSIKSSETIKIVRTLKKGHTVLMLPDQYMVDKHSATVTFLGVQTQAITAPAKLASLTQSTLLIAYIKETPNSYQFIVEPPLNPELTGDLIQDTQLINHRLSEIILSQPEHYFWLHNRFKDLLTTTVESP